MGKKSKTPEIAESFWGATKKKAGKGLQRGFQRRVENAVAGSDVGQASSAPAQSVASGSSVKWGVVLVAVALILFAGWGPVSDCFASGWCETRIGEPVRDAVKPLKSTLEYVGDQAQKIRRISAGEQIFDWEGDVEENIRTGIWFDDGLSYGTGDLFEVDGSVREGLSQSEFGARISINVGKMDEAIKDITADVSCSMENITGSIRNFNDGKVRLVNPYPENRRKYNNYLDCVFSGTDASAIQRRLDRGTTYFSSKIIFDLSYSLEPQIFLPVFVIPDEDIYNEYIGMSQEAFENLEGGIYEDYISYNDNNVRSVMQFMSDVEAIMRISPQQPISPASGKSFTFSVQFRNTDVENTAYIEKFELNLPEGIEIGDSASRDGTGTCEYFIGSNGNYVLNEEYFDEINRELNRGTGQTKPYPCKLRVDSSLSQREDQILALGTGIQGALKFRYVISDEVSLGN